ncbi:MAG: rhodanese-like domain-containing protein [Bacteroidota bacterium]
MKTTNAWKNWFTGIVLLLAVVPMLCACTNNQGGENISVQDLQKKMAKDKGIVVLDVRTVPELTAELGKIDGVVNIPVQELEQRLAEMKRYQKSPVYVICRSGNRSGVATGILRQHGYDAYNVTGGMRAWREAFGEKNR